MLEEKGASNTPKSQFTAIQSFKAIVRSNLLEICKEAVVVQRKKILYEKSRILQSYHFQGAFDAPYLLDCHVN